MLKKVLESINKTRAIAVAIAVGTVYVLLVKNVFPLKSLDDADFAAAGIIGSVVAIAVEVVSAWLSKARPARRGK